MTGLDFIIALVCVGFISISIWLLKGKHRQIRIINYRRLYIQLIARIETVTVRVSQLSKLAEHLEGKSGFKYYEDTVVMLESLLTALNRLPPLSDSAELVRSLEPMVQNLEGRIDKCHSSFRKDLYGRKELSQLLGDMEKISHPVKGCYFCSKPFSHKSFKRVPVKFQGKKISVFGCSRCRAELRSRKTIDILYFVHGGKTVHWSELPSYNPETDYWTLSSLKTATRRTQLELVKADPPHE